MIDKALLTGAFEKMGPVRVERMLLAFGPAGTALNYCRCALGFAAGYGNDAPGGRLDREKDATKLDYVPFLALRLDITEREAHAIEALHFDRTRATGRAFVASANEWLENRPASPGNVVLRSVSREPVCVGANARENTP